ncbi:MAG: DivIVA domain-containing protein [Acidimicrobiia bacterium]
MAQRQYDGVVAADRSREDRAEPSGSRESEVRRPASGATRLTPEEITSRGFASAFRGVSETEVRNFLRRVADELAAARDHERSRAQRVAELEERLRNPPPLDEKQLLDGLGEETTRVLRSAQEAAADIRARAEERSAALLQEANDTAKQLRDEADAHAAERTSTAEAAAAEREREAIERADAVRADADRAAAETAERATVAADAEIERTRETGRAMVEEARAVRERVLADLARRRALMQAQLDGLRTGREQLLDAYRVVKQTLADAIAALGSVQAKAHAEGGIDIEAVPEDGIEFSLDASDDTSDHVSAPAPGQASRPSTDAGDASDAPEVNGAGPGENPASGSAVDALFARLKGARAEPEPEPAAGAATVASGESGAASDEQPRIAPLKKSPSEDSVTVDLAAEEPAPAPTKPVANAAEIPPELAARDEAVAKVRSALGRRAKRALQDEQNELLDALRKTKGRPTAEAVLPSAEVQSSAWAEVLAPGVDEVYRTAMRVTSPGATIEGVPRDALVGLAAELGAPLRERLVSAFSTSSADGNPEDVDVAQRVGSRYREWRTQALDGALADALVGAWALGTIAAAPDDARLRWVTPAGGCCPDCDDDALEATSRGEAFPTGHLAPPAHPGCLCVVVVETMSISSATVGTGPQ